MKKLLSILKKAGIITGIIIFIILLAIIIIHSIFITPSYVKKIIVQTFQNSFNTKVELDIDSISLIKGIEIRNFKIYNPAFSSKKTLFKINQLNVKYNLLYLLLLKIQVNEILLDNPDIFLEYSYAHKKWNFANFIKPSEKKEEEKKPKRSKGPLKVNFKLVRFALNNLSFEFIKDQYLKLKGISLSADARLNKMAFEGIKSCHFKFLSHGEKNIIYKNKNMIVMMPLDLFINLNIKDQKNGKFQLIYNLKDQLVELNKKFIKIPNLNINIDSEISVQKAQYILNQFSIDINKNRILNLSGKIKNLTSSPDILLTMQENSLNLSDFQNIARVFLNRENLNLSGFFKTSKFLFQKRPGDMLPLILGKFNLNKVYLSLPNNKINVNDLNFSAQFKSDKKQNINGMININISSILANILKIKNFNLTSSLAMAPDKNIRKFNLLINDCKINRGDFAVDISIQKKKLNGEIKITDLDISEFNKSIYGKLNLKNRIQSVNLNDFDNSLDISIPDFRFISKVKNMYYHSSRIPIEITTSQQLNTKGPNLAIHFFNVKISDFFNFLFRGNYESGSFYGNIEEMKIITQNIAGKLPENIKYGLPFQTFDGIINTTGNIKLKDNKLTANILTTNDKLYLENRDGGFRINDFYSRINMTNAGPDNNIRYLLTIADIKNKTTTYNSNSDKYETKYTEFLNQIKLYSDISKVKNRIDINTIALTIPNVNFNFNVFGSILPGKKQDIKLTANMKFQPDSAIHFLKNGKFKGTLELNTKVNSSLAKDSLVVDGKVLFNHLSFFMNNIIIDDVDGYLPFRHIVSKNKIDRKFLITKSVKKDMDLLNYSLNRAYTKKPDNLTINKIQIKEIKIDKFAFDMEYNDNFLSLRNGYMELLDGSILINNSYFDLGNMNPDTFRYKFNLELSGIDIRNLEMIKVVDPEEDTRIYANIRLNGKGIDFKKSGDIYGAFNITHIGKDVAARLLTAMDPKEKDGNVSYIKELLYRGAWCDLITLEVKFGQIFPRIWLDKPGYMIWLPLPPSPVEFKDKSLDVTLKTLILF